MEILIMTKPREEFVSLIKESDKVVNIVADYLSSKGYPVRALPIEITPDEESRWEHTDNGDIEIVQRIEVKHWPKIDFKSIKDIPYNNVIVDEAYKIEKKLPLPLFGHVIVNASKTGYIWIPAWTKPLWFKETLHDTREDRDGEFYLIDKSRLTYYELR